MKKKEEEKTKNDKLLKKLYRQKQNLLYKQKEQNVLSEHIPDGE